MDTALMHSFVGTICMDTALMHSTSWGYAWNHLHGYCPNAFNVMGLCLEPFAWILP